MNIAQSHAELGAAAELFSPWHFLGGEGNRAIVGATMRLWKAPHCCCIWGEISGPISGDLRPEPRRDGTIVGVKGHRLATKNLSPLHMPKLIFTACNYVRNAITYGHTHIHSRVGVPQRPRKVEGDFPRVHPRRKKIPRLHFRFMGTAGSHMKIFCSQTTTQFRIGQRMYVVCEKHGTFQRRIL